MGCKFLIEHDTLVKEEEITLEYIGRVNVDIDSEEFESHTMNRFSAYISVAKRLWDSLSPNYKVVKSAYANVVKIEAISKIMEIQHLPTLC